jgi:hypothetical protein
MSEKLVNDNFSAKITISMDNNGNTGVQFETAGDTFQPITMLGAIEHAKVLFIQQYVKSVQQPLPDNLN